MPKLTAEQLAELVRSKPGGDIGSISTEPDNTRQMLSGAPRIISAIIEASIGSPSPAQTNVPKTLK